MARAALKLRHQDRGHIIQINLMYDSGRISWGPKVADLPTAFHHLTDLVSRIHVPGLSSQEIQWLHDQVFQEGVWKGRNTLPEIALAATGGHPVCPVPSCKCSGHTKTECWQAGQDMYGKEAQMCEIIAQRREANGGSSGRGGKQSNRGGKSDNNPFRKATNSPVMS